MDAALSALMGPPVLPEDTIYEAGVSDAGKQWAKIYGPEGGLTFMILQVADDAYELHILPVSEDVASSMPVTIRQFKDSPIPNSTYDYLDELFKRTLRIVAGPFGKKVGDQ